MFSSKQTTPAAERVRDRGHDVEGQRNGDAPLVEAGERLGKLAKYRLRVTC
jgi:hypothetical protein